MPRVTSTVFRKPTNLATAVASHLREQIISGTLDAGARVNETRVMQELALSRSPVREALRILEAEGLVTLEPHRGAVVRPLSEDELREIFDARLMLETHALRAAARGLAAEALAPVAAAAREARARLTAGSVAGWYEASLRLHDALVALGGNRHVTRLYEELKVSLRRYQVGVVGMPRQAERSQREHEAIVAALARGDVEAATTALGAHIAGVADALLERRTAG
jgi:DNA-binding GntR family transcriptional regulator